jgi:outer membrane receptor protein involved in Fe transport
MRYETVTVVNPLPGGKEEQYLSPQIGISWQLSSSTVLHTALGRGIRIPVLGERFLQFDQPIPFRPNPFIRTERSFAYELGVRATSFYATLVNIVQAQIPGVEVSGKFRFWDNRLGLDASATWTDPHIKEAGEAGDIPITFQDDDPLTYRPRFIAYVTPSLSLGPLTLEADYSYASEVEVQLFTTDQRVPKKQLDARLLASWSNLTLQFSVRNLLQYYYTQVERNFNEVRSFSTGLMWEY